MARSSCDKFCEDVRLFLLCVFFAIFLTNLPSPKLVNYKFPVKWTNVTTSVGGNESNGSTANVTQDANNGNWTRCCPILTAQPDIFCYPEVLKDFQQHKVYYRCIFGISPLKTVPVVTMGWIICPRRIGHTLENSSGEPSDDDRNRISPDRIWLSNCELYYRTRGEDNSDLPIWKERQLYSTATSNYIFQL